MIAPTPPHEGDPFRRLLKLLGHDESSQIVVCHRAKGSSAAPTPNIVTGITEAQRVVFDRASTCDVWFEVHHMGPLGEAGRGREELCTRASALVADLDVKPGGLGDLETCQAVVDKLTAHLGTPPGAIIRSGGGLHVYWRIIDGTDVARAGAQLKRWRQLVKRCAAEAGGAADSVQDLARILRVPGTYNRKGAPVLITAEFPDDAEPLTLDEIDDRLTDAAIPTARDEPPGEGAAPAAGWATAGATCHYAAAMLEAWQLERVDSGSRHAWLVSQATRLAAAHRLGCLADPDLARQALAMAFERVMAIPTGDPTGRTAPGYLEVDSALEWGVARAEAMSEAEARAELGDHEHRGTARATVVDWHAPDLERDVFGATPTLARVLDTARAAMLSPWAVLGALLARAVAMTEPGLVIPAFIADRASLNIAVAVVGPSGSGKSGAAAVAAGMIEGPHVDVVTPSSGEGLVAMFAERDGRGDDAALVRTRALTVVDEIKALGGVQDRSGSTLAATIRSAITGAALSNYAADPTRRRAIAAHAYRWCIVAGAQLGTARVLLDDADGGTPQRFLWVAADDPRAVSDHPAPDPVPIRGPRVNLRGEVAYPERVGAQVRSNRLLIQRGEAGALDGHAMLVRLKVAAALAMIHERTERGPLEVDEALWEIAGLILEHSDRVRSRVLEHHRHEAEQQSRIRGRMDAAREIGASDELLERAALAIARKVQRASGPLTRQAVRDAVGRYRVERGAAIALAVERRWVVEVEIDGARLYQAGAVKVAP